MDPHSIAENEQHTSDFGLIRSFDTMIVRIETACGIVGYGEGRNVVGSAANCGTLAHLVNHDFGPRIVGEDPRRINRIWDVLYNGVRSGYTLERGHVFPELARRGMTVAAISAIDIALWDILGKSLDVPVAQLLGGARVDRMAAYASGGWSGPEEIAAELGGYIARDGYGSVKMRLGVMDGNVRKAADRVIAAREGLGPDIEIMCDAHGTFTVAEAKRFCHLVRDCDLRWLEEPVTSDDKAGTAEVRRSSPVPISAGESEFTRFDFRDLIEARAVDILQPDLAICGGITEGMRIGALAATHNLELALHLWGGAVNFAAGLQVAAASTSSRIIEYSVGGNPMLHDLAEEDFIVEDGMIAVPSGPGLGITVREEVLEAYGVA